MSCWREVVRKRERGGEEGVGKVNFDPVDSLARAVRCTRTILGCGVVGRFWLLGITNAAHNHVISLTICHQPPPPPT